MRLSYTVQPTKCVCVFSQVIVVSVAQQRSSQADGLFSLDGQRHLLLNVYSLSQPCVSGRADPGHTALLASGRFHPPLSLLFQHIKYFHTFIPVAGKHEHDGGGLRLALRIVSLARLRGGGRRRGRGREASAPPLKVGVPGTVVFGLSQCRADRAVNVRSC